MMMLEKLECCPICGEALDQADYDLQRHADHWHTFPPIHVGSRMTAYRFTPPDPIQLSDFVALIATMMANDVQIVCDETTAVALDANPECKRLLTKVEEEA